MKACMMAPAGRPHFEPLSPRNDVKQRDWKELTNRDIFGSDAKTPVDLLRALRLPELERRGDLSDAKRWAETTRFTNIKSGAWRPRQRQSCRWRRRRGMTRAPTLRSLPGSNAPRAGTHRALDIW